MPRLGLRPGAGFAVVTFTRWAIVIIGAALTLAALGIDMAKVTLLASAVGVGIGFGLQNVVNNFVSGLILIVERPVGVGDVIERGTLSGTVTRIGIRSSTVRTAQGAEVIVPNGDLVSKEVVNWTRSDRQRRYDIDVSVAPGAEPEQVMRLLVVAASDVPEIMTDPAPRAMFKGFGANSLDFTLFAWVPTIDVGVQAQNALRVAIRRKLDQAGIAILPSIGKSARDLPEHHQPRLLPCMRYHFGRMPPRVAAGRAHLQRGSRRRRMRRTSNRARIPMRRSASIF